MDDNIIDSGSSAIEQTSAATTPTETVPVSSTDTSQASTTSTTSTETPSEENVWYISEGVRGTGEKPDWFNDKTFPTMFDQAKGYNPLKSQYDKKYKGFTGAPEGDYKIELDDSFKDSDYKLDTETQAFKDMSELARSQGMSQKAFNENMNLFAKYESNAIKQQEEYITNAIQKHNDEVIASMSPELIEEFKQCKEMALNFGDAPEDGLNSYLKGITEKSEIEAFNWLVKKSLPSNAPQSIQKTASSNPDQEAYDAHKRYNSLPYGPEKDAAKLVMQEKYRIARELGNK